MVKEKTTFGRSSPDLSLHILDQEKIDSLADGLSNTLGNLQDLFETIRLVSNLDVCIYPPPRQAASSNINAMPVGYRRHMSAFCLAAKRTRDGRGCGGHDSTYTNAKAAEIGKPFVQTCHRGVAEVIVPIFSASEHLGTVFIGQVVTSEIEDKGFDAIWENARSQVTRRASLERGYDMLTRMTEQKLLGIGMLVDAAIRGLADQLTADAFAMEVRLQSAPAICRAVDILNQERCWDITACEMAKRVHLSPAHFSRLFHRIMGITFLSYLTQLRITRAQTLLHHSNMTIAQITQQCGFNRQSYFTRRFREACGMTPTQYRTNTAKQ